MLQKDAPHQGTINILMMIMIAIPGQWWQSQRYMFCVLVGRNENQQQQPELNNGNQLKQLESLNRKIPSWQYSPTKKYYSSNSKNDENCNCNNEQIKHAWSDCDGHGQPSLDDFRLAALSCEVERSVPAGGFGFQRLAAPAQQDLHG
eukprot:5903228-Amphidinium_carterae.1